MGLVFERQISGVCHGGEGSHEKNGQAGTNRPMAYPTALRLRAG
jgi:hypothetical protein